MSEDLTFKEKYLMYKAKYLNLKNNPQKGGGEKDSILLFKSENCGYCTKFKSTWDALQNTYGDRFNFITYDNIEHQDKMNEFNISGVPTIYRVSGNNKYLFEGDRDIESLMAFLS